MYSLSNSRKRNLSKKQACPSDARSSSVNGHPAKFIQQGAPDQTWKTCFPAVRDLLPERRGRVRTPNRLAPRMATCLQRTPSVTSSAHRRCSPTNPQRAGRAVAPRTERTRPVSCLGPGSSAMEGMWPGNVSKPRGATCWEEVDARDVSIASGLHVIWGFTREETVPRGRVHERRMSCVPGRHGEALACGRHCEVSLSPRLAGKPSGVHTERLGLLPEPPVRGTCFPFPPPGGRSCPSSSSLPQPSPGRGCAITGQHAVCFRHGVPGLAGPPLLVAVACSPPTFCPQMRSMQCGQLPTALPEVRHFQGRQPPLRPLLKGQKTTRSLGLTEGVCVQKA